MDWTSIQLQEQWISAISKKSDKPVTLQRVGVIGGGSINDAHRIETSSGSFFAKTNVADLYPGMFEAEAKGLQFLSKHSSFRIPEPVGTGVFENTQWIVMTNITPTNKSASYWEDFARKLAKMHRQSASSFGLDYDNYLGSLQQYNSATDNWGEFFIHQRLEPQLKMATDRNLSSSELKRYFEKLYRKAGEIFPKEPPAALHGDLWTGNFMTDEKGDATIFDPAVYFGHREMDIAMSKLFGGFDKRFYDAYNEDYPLEKGWEQRIPIANIYPLMAHVNIFGGSYTSQVMSILRRYA